MHPYADTYDKLYRDHADYRMRPWRQTVYRQWLTRRGFPEMAYLDVGCGRAESLDIAEDLYPSTRYGCDIAPELCKRGDVTLLENGARELPWSDETFDLVSCCDVLEHMTPVEAPMAIAEILRVMKPTGAALIGIPHKHTMNALHIIIEDAAWWEGRFRMAPNFKSFVVLTDFDIPQIKQPYSFWELRRA